MASVALKSLDREPTHFSDRSEAGLYLARRLADLSGRNDLLVLGIPRGGVPVAYEVAKALHAPLDVIVVRKLGFPGEEELAMGAIASGGVRVLNQEVLQTMRVPPRIIDIVAAQELKELERREKAYRGERLPYDPAKRTLIVVDDGLATGSSMRAAVTGLRQRGPAAIVVAVPVGATSTCRSIAHLADRLECVIESPAFFSVGEWYEDFCQTTDEEVQRFLGRLSPAKGTNPGHKQTRQQPDFLIEEGGKTGTMALKASGDRAASASLRPGDRVVLAIESQKLVVKDSDGSTVGTVEPQIAKRLSRLIKRGNSYEAGILSTAGGKVMMLIREAKQAPSLAGTQSFPANLPLHEIDTGPFEKRQLGIDVTDLKGLPSTP